MKTKKPLGRPPLPTRIKDITRNVQADIPMALWRKIEKIMLEEKTGISSMITRGFWALLREYKKK